MRRFPMYSALLLTAVCLFLPASWAGAQEVIDFTHTSTGEIRFNVDCSGFPRETGNALLEIYFRVPYDQLSFVDAVGAEAAEAGFSAAIILKDIDGKMVLSNKYDFPFKTMKDKAARAGESVYDLFRCSVFPGRYRCEITIGDLHGSNVGVAEFFIDVGGWPVEDELWGVGDLQIAWDFAKKPAESDLARRLTKYGITIIPNAARTYYKTQPFVTFFYEAIVNHDVRKEVLVSYDITDRYGKVYRSFPPSNLTWEPGVNAEWGKLPIITLPANFYFLSVRVHNKAGEEVLALRKLFFFRKDESKVDPLDIHSVLLDEDDMAEYTDKFIKYLGKPEDAAAFKKLTTAYSKRIFIEEWWRRVAVEKKLPPLEFQRTALVRANIADTRYADAYKTGWRTDRGRIYIKYGEPVDIERSPYELGMDPYKIWTYIIAGKERYFKFSDTTGNGDFRLVESNLEGEFYQGR